MLIRPGDRHRDHHIDLRVAVQALGLLVVLRHDAVLRQGGVQVDHVRHHRRAEDPDREQHRLAAGERRRHRVQRHRPERRVRVEELRDVRDPDHADEGRDHGFERAQSEALEGEDREGADTVTYRRDEDRHPKQQVEAQRRPQELGQVGCHRDQLRLHPEAPRGPAGELLAADLGQVAAGGDPELRRERLDQHRHQVRGEDHPAERVAELRAAGDVGREVAGVDVGDAGDEGGAEEGRMRKGLGNPRRARSAASTFPVATRSVRVAIMRLSLAKVRRA